MTAKLSLHLDNRGSGLYSHHRDFLLEHLNLLSERVPLFLPVNLRRLGVSGSISTYKRLTTLSMAASSPMSDVCMRVSIFVFILVLSVALGATGIPGVPQTYIRAKLLIKIA